MTILFDGNTSYICCVYRMRMNYIELKKQLVQQTNRWKPSAILIENKASGQQLIQEFQSGTQLPIVQITPTENKLQRVYKCLAFFIESEKISPAQQAIWLMELEHELFNFPQNSHDDQLDALTQYILWHQKKCMAKVRLSTI